MRSYLESGCDDFIRKPYRDTELFDALIKHLGVRFIFDQEKEAVVVDTDLKLDKDRFKRVPPDLIESLREAIVLLDRDHCIKEIGMISAHDHELGQGLHQMVEALQYKKILAALDKAIGTGS